MAIARLTNGSHQDVLQNLAERIREIESTCHRRSESRLNLGIPALERLFPEGKLASGSLMELVSTLDGTGAWTLALFMARNVCENGKALIVADGQRCFYPPAAAKLGIDLTRLIVLRPKKPCDLYAAVEQSLRCQAVGAVVGWFNRLAGVDGRRLQLAAEVGGGLSLLLRPPSSLRAPSFAAIRLEIAPLVVSLIPTLTHEGGGKRKRSLLHPLRQGQKISSLPPAGGGLGWEAESRCITVKIVRCHGGKSGQSLNLEIADETGDVHLLPEVASAATLRRQARTSG